MHIVMYVLIVTDIAYNYLRFCYYDCFIISNKVSLQVDIPYRPQR